MNVDKDKDSLVELNMFSTSRPASPLQPRFVSFDSASPGLESLDGYYDFDLSSDAFGIFSECENSADTSNSVTDVLPTAIVLEEMVQSFSTYCKMDDSGASENDTKLTDVMGRQLFEPADFVVTAPSVYQATAAELREQSTQTDISCFDEYFSVNSLTMKTGSKRVKLYE